MRELCKIPQSNCRKHFRYRNLTTKCAGIGCIWSFKIIKDLFFRAGAVAASIVAAATQLTAAEIAPASALERARVWIGDSHVMRSAGRGIGGISRFPDSGGYAVYVVSLTPRGYVIMNSDDTLPPVAAYSAESQVDLADTPDNAFRAMLLRYTEKAAARLASVPPATLRDSGASSTGLAPAAASVTTTPKQHGPFMDSSWNQNHPYNKFCPVDTNGSPYYGGRVPTGCTPTAFAQVMFYHRWPLRGSGQSSYTDANGATTGDHTATYSDEYNWASMQKSYDAYASTPVEHEDAVAELMYELGVAAEADYEAGGTSSSIYTLGMRLGQFFHYSGAVFHQSYATLHTPMVEDLRRGLPCVVAVPGHAIVADGLLIENNVTNLHINYGWGGNNNGWWTADNVVGDALDYGMTSITPKLLASPVTTSITGNVAGVSLKWHIPKRIDSRVGTLNLYGERRNPAPWQNGASSMPANSSGWSLYEPGRDGGACWYSGPNVDGSLTLDEILVPDVTSQLSFWRNVKIATGTFLVLVSDDGGDTFEELFSETGSVLTTWRKHSIPLQAYSGKRVMVRFQLKRGNSYYPSGGVWVDDVAMETGEVVSWEKLVEGLEVDTREFSSEETLLDECMDFSFFENTSTDPYKTWISAATGGVESCFFKPAGGSSNTKYHITSVAPVTLGAHTRLVMRSKRQLASERFVVLVSPDRVTFTEIWSKTGSQDWADETVDLSQYSGQSLYLRIQYADLGAYYSSGGIWIDRISLQTVENTDCEDQPEYTTSLGGIEPGLYALRSTITDNDGLEHPKGDVFTLDVPASSTIPEWWRTQYGIGRYEQDDADLDNDKFSNIEEYIAGTHPHDGASKFTVALEGTMTIRWNPSLTGRRYSVEYADTPTGPFHPLHETDGPVSSHTDSTTAPARFYRVGVSEAP